MMAMTSFTEETVTCCGSDLNFHVSEMKENINYGISEVKYTLKRSWIKTKKVKDKFLDRNR